MAIQAFRILGQVIHQVTGQGVAGLRVEAWDKDLIFDDMVGSALTDAAGRFEIEFSESHFRGIFFDRRPDLFFKVFDGPILLKSTKDSIVWNASTASEVTIMVDVVAAQQGSIPQGLAGELKIEAGVVPPDTRLTASIVTFNDPTGPQLGTYTFTTRSVNWSINFNFADVAGPAATPETFRPHIRFQVFRIGRQGRSKTHELYRFNADLYQPFTLVFPNAYYPEIERVERALARMSTPGTDEETAVRLQIVAAEEGIPLAAFDIFDQSQAEAALTQLSLELAYAFVRVRTLQNKPILTDDISILRFAVAQGYVDDNVLNADSLQQVLAWRQRQDDAKEEERRRELANEEAEKEKKRREAERKKLLEEEERNRVQEQRAEAAAEQLLRYRDDDTPLGAILKSVGLPGNVRLAYARILVDKPGASDDEVETRLQSLRVSNDDRDTIGRVRSLISLIGDHPPLFTLAWQALRITRWTTGVPDLSAFAEKTPADWEQILTDQEIEPPKDIRGSDLADRRRRYARALELQFDRIYPQQTITARLSGNDGLRDVVALLNEHPSLDLRTQLLPLALLQSEEEPAAKLRSLQRLIRVAPASEAVTLLMNTNLTSAAAIATLPEAAFVDIAVQAGVSEERASEIHLAALDKSILAMMFAANLTPQLIDFKPGTVTIDLPQPDPEDPPPTSPSVETLFGAEGACAVKPCQSVLGLPAYFVDLLEAVRHNGNKANLLDDTLLARRPDLQEIELSCENSDTRLPYIDLVNEILERAVAGKSNTPPFPQTTWDEDDLAAAPEHLEGNAYQVLQQADYPWSLPFSLAQEEARTYLAHLGTDLARLSDLLNPPTMQSTRFAGEHLGMPERELSYFGAFQAVPEARLWGVAGNPGNAWAGEEIAQVRKFMDHAGVSWLELLDLLVCDYINPGHAASPFTAANPAPATAPVYVVLGPDPCNLTQASLVGLHREFLRRFRLFVRLWRRLGWTVRELDHAIAVSDEDSMLKTVLKLVAMERLRTSLQLPVTSVTTLYGDIDHQARWDMPESPSPRQPSHFDRLFQDKSTLSAPQRASMATALDVLTGANPEILSLHAATIRAVVGMSEAEFQLLTKLDSFTESIGVAPPPAPPSDWEWRHVFVEKDELTIPSLSRLFRVTTLARALRVSVPDLLRFRAITGIDPFSDPKNTLEFIVALDRQRGADFTIAELDYLLRDRGEFSVVVAAGRERNVARLKDSFNKAQLAGDLLSNLVCAIAAKHFRMPVQVLNVLFGQVAGAEPPVQFAKDLRSAGANEQAAALLIYTRLEKAVYAIEKLGLAPDEANMPADAVLRPCAALDWQNLSAWSKWAELVDLVHVRNRLAAQKVWLWQVREDARKGIDVAPFLSTTAAELTALTQAALHELDGTEWRRILDALETVRSLGVPVTTAKEWVRPPGIAGPGEVSLTHALEIRSAARARHNAESWKNVARVLRDPLREKQRNALVAYLCMNNGAMLDSADLYDRYLVDVEMGAQQNTTRIELAVASVQLFVQRVLLGSEDNNGEPLTFVSDFADRWEWMKRYESWANSRRVFLYPENYLRPDLRADKSPIFVEAEEALSQRQLKAENLEDIVADYVEKLDEIARLEVVGTCMEEQKNEDQGYVRESLLHIVARTNGQPNVYYHRTWEAPAKFTPWRKIDLNIEGDCVFPIIRDNRLTLYWIKQEKDMEGLKDSVGMASAQPFPLQPHFPMFQDQYRLSWSTLYRGKWLPKKTADRLIARPFLPFMETKFAVRVVGDRVRISGLTVLQTNIGSAFNG